MNSSDSDREEEYFDCVADVKYCAIASPKSQGTGEVFLDIKEARSKWKELKGSRMKMFDNYHEAEKFAHTPVELIAVDNCYPPSPKPDVEATPFSSVPPCLLLKFRSFIERGDVDSIRCAIEDNPMTLVTPSDTPTLLQIRLRYNAIHVAASAGREDIMELLLSYLNSNEFWRRIYPGSDDSTSWDRQLHVTDLYLNSPELGNLETPLHFASKFGHITCVRLLAAHPFTQLDVKNRAGQTAAMLAASRMSDGTRQNLPSSDFSSRALLVSNSIRRLLDEHFVLLADVCTNNSFGERKVTILPPVSFNDFQSLLARLCPSISSGLLSVFPFLLLECNRLRHIKDQTDVPQPGLDLAYMGANSKLVSLRGFAGPMPLDEATAFRKKWIDANSSKSLKVFGSVRLTDPEKGYERQGRHISRMNGVQWREYWAFIDDYIDLASEQGLAVFENYFKDPGASLAFRLNQESTASNGSVSHRRCNQTNVVGPEDDCRFNEALKFDGATPSTPIIRQKPPVPSESVKDQDPWNTYRINCSTANILNDSLEESTDASNLHSSVLDTTSEDMVSKSGPLSTRLTPIVSLLQRLTFASPLRWLLVETPSGQEPLFNPESALPDHKKLVKIQSSPGKRRMSAIDPDAPKGDEQPVPKKPSPKKSQLLKVSPLHKHIYRALPGGDLELETAVRLLCCTRKSIPPDHVPSSDLSNFPAIAAWRQQIEAALYTEFH